MEFQGNKDNKANLAMEEERAEKAHEEHQANPVVSSQFQGHKRQLAHQDLPEKSDLKDSQAKMGNPSMDHPDSQVMPDNPERKVAPDQPALQGHPEKQAKRAHASIVLHPELHQVIRTHPSIGHFSKMPNWIHPLYFSTIFTQILAQNLLSIFKPTQNRLPISSLHKSGIR
jgi:hypothetical protein